MARPRCCRICKISVFDAVLRHFYFPFSQHSRLLSSKKGELATRSIFLPLYVDHCFRFEYSWSFAISGDQSLEVWQRTLRMTGDHRRRSQIFEALLPFFFFFASCLIFLKKAFSERKIALEIFSKKDEGTLQITVQSMTDATFESVGQVRKAIFACLTTD